ncbi:MAG: hypothetical protein EOP53_07435 [Sphingobacteriales bacterium]|nr:MAG: hypothetical protein EOP53_07435 [Sphingobacteriales bacterium]
MNKQRAINIIREPLRMEHEKDLPLIKELIEEFPYFSAPYVLLTKLLSEQKSIYLDKYLKLSASYIGDREVLYHLIHAPIIKENLHIAADEKILQPEEKTVTEKTEGSVKEQAAEQSHIAVVEKIPQPEIAEAKIAAEEILNIEVVNNSLHNAEKASIIQISEADNTTENIPVTETRAVENIDEIKTEVQEEETETLITERTEDNLPSRKYREELQEEIVETSGNSNALPETLNSIQAEPDVIKLSDEEIFEPINLTESQPVEVEATAQEPEVKKNNIPLELPPLAAYDYFAFRDKKEKVKSEKPIVENTADVALESSSVKEESDVSTADKIFAKQEKLSFGEWLKIVSVQQTADLKPIVSVAHTVVNEPITIQNKPIENRKPKREDIDGIISKFIQTEPRIKPKPAKFFTPQDVAERSAAEDNTLVTETLANIYLKQGLNDKALEIFQQLMLKYPQKSNYFAVKIEEINTKP